MSDMKSRFEGCFLGLAVGDALGEPWEFHLRTAIEPYDIMTTYRGRVTDDTMMTIALAKALIEGEGYRRDKVVEQFVKWLDDTGKAPGIGCLSACRRSVTWRELHLSGLRKLNKGDRPG